MKPKLTLATLTALGGLLLAGPASALERAELGGTRLDVRSTGPHVVKRQASTALDMFAIRAGAMRDAGTRRAVLIVDGRAVWRGPAAAASDALRLTRADRGPTNGTRAAGDRPSVSCLMIEGSIFLDADGKPDRELDAMECDDGLL